MSILLHPLLLPFPSVLSARNTTLNCLHAQSRAHIFYSYGEAQALFHVHQDVRRIGEGTHNIPVLSFDHVRSHRMHCATTIG